MRLLSIVSELLELFIQVLCANYTDFFLSRNCCRKKKIFLTSVNCWCDIKCNWILLTIHFCWSFQMDHLIWNILLFLEETFSIQIAWVKHWNSDCIIFHTYTNRTVWNDFERSHFSEHVNWLKSNIDIHKRRSTTTW